MCHVPREDHIDLIRVEFVGHDLVGVDEVRREVSEERVLLVVYRGHVRRGGAVVAAEG